MPENPHTSEQSPLLASSSTSQTLAEDDEISVLSSKTADIPFSRTRGVLIAISVWILIFILTCNVSLMSTIQSSIAVELDAYSSVSWFTSAYLIALTGITPVAGRLSKIFTSRIYLFSSILTQSCGLLITSQSTSLTVFLVGRVVTGIGSAAITPVSLILVTELTSKRRHGLFFGCINTAYTTGVACGAIIAGALEPMIGWRAVFWIQIPLTISAALLALYSIPRPVEDMTTSFQSSTLTQKVSRIDYFGLASLITCIVLFLVGLSASKIQITPILLSLATLVLFIFVEASWANEPIIPPSVLKSRANIFTGLATMGAMTARWAILFYAPVYAIAVRGWSQASAGLMLIPTNAGFACGGILVGWLHIRRPGAFYGASLTTFACFSLSELVISQISTAHSNIHVYIVILFINGFITGALLNYSLTHLLHLTLPSMHAIVIPVNTMFRALSGSFGSAVSGGFFLRSLQSSLEYGFRHEDIPDKAGLIRRLVGTPNLVSKLSGIEHEVAVDAYVTAFRSIFLFGSILSMAMLFVQAGTGWRAPEEVDDGHHTSDGGVVSPIISREPIAN